MSLLSIASAFRPQFLRSTVSQTRARIRLFSEEAIDPKSLSAYNNFAKAKHGSGDTTITPPKKEGSIVGNATVLLELRRRLDEAPAQPGIYLFKDALGRLLYVGKSVNLRQRTKSYFSRLPPVEDLRAEAAAEARTAQAVAAEQDLVGLGGRQGFTPATALGRRQATMVRLTRELETIVTEDAAEALMLEVSVTSLASSLRQ